MFCFVMIVVISCVSKLTIVTLDLLINITMNIIRNIGVNIGTFNVKFKFYI